MVFDQASAAMAKGEVMLADRDGHALPDGVGITSDGTPTNDPRAVLDGGCILPFGGYKGSGLGRQCGMEGLEIFTETKTVGWPAEG